MLRHSHPQKNISTKLEAIIDKQICKRWEWERNEQTKHCETKNNPQKQRKKQDKINYQQYKLQKWVGFVLAIYGRSMGLPLSRHYIHSEILLEKTKFFLVSIYQLGLGMGICVCFSSQHWDPICLSPVEALGMLPQSLWVHMCVSLVLLKVLLL